MKRQRWADLTGTRRAVLIAATVVQVGLQGATLWDLHRRPADFVRGPKAMWAALSFVNFAGPLAYVVLGRQGDPACIEPILYDLP